MLSLAHCPGKRGRPSHVAWEPRAPRLWWPGRCDLVMGLPVRRSQDSSAQERVQSVGHDTAGARPRTQRSRADGRDQWGGRYGPSDADESRAAAPPLAPRQAPVPGAAAGLGTPDLYLYGLAAVIVLGFLASP